MQKKIIALAVAGLASTAAFAQSSNVTVYGRANMGLDTYGASGAANGGGSNLNTRTRVFDSGSRLGFRGTEDLGGGMKAGFTIEAGVNMDNAGATGAGNFGQNGAATNGSSGGIASRDSWLSIGGNWGEVRTGRISLFWGDGALNQTAANYVNGGVTLTTGVGTGLVTGPTNRTNNVLAYVSPNFSGFSAMLGYVASAEGHGAANAAAGTAANANNKTNAAGWSTRFNYANGPFTALADYTALTAQDTEAVTGINKNIGMKLGLGYSYAPGSQVAFIWSQLRNNNITAAVGTIANAGDDLRQSAWTLNWEHTMGNTQLLGQYARASNASGMTGATTGSSDIRQWMLGAKYNLSKRTGMYVTYNRIQNAELAFSDYAGGGYTSSQNAAGAGTLGVQQRGADPTVIAVGVMHNF